jgi:hypothetical protein
MHTSEGLVMFGGAFLITLGVAWGMSHLEAWLAARLEARRPAVVPV